MGLITDKEDTRMKLIKTIISAMAYEIECSYCGGPILINDYVYYDENDTPYCCKGCAKIGQEV